MEIKRKTRLTLPVLAASFLAMSILFGWRFILDFSADGRAHIYAVGFAECFSAFLWVYGLFELFVRRRQTDVHVFFALAAAFGVYYVALTVVRMRLGGDYADSLDLFRRILTAAVLYLIIGLRRLQARFLYRFYLYFYIFLSAGYCVAVVFQGTFTPQYPDYSMTYTSISSVTVSVALFGFARRERLRLSALDQKALMLTLALSSANGIITGSRVASVLLLVNWAAGLALFCRAARGGVATALRCGAVSLLLVGALCAANVFYCRSNVARIFMQTYDEGPAGNTTKEGLEQSIQLSMGRRELLRGTGKDVGFMFDNPTDISDDMRAYIRLLALDSLEDDWLFSIKGKTSFTVDLLGFEIRSGAHNFILDYTLAFGLAGTILLAFLPALPALLLVCAAVRRKKWTTLWGSMLSLATLLAYGMVQAIFSSLLPLAVLFFLLGFWRQLLHEETAPPEKKRVAMLVTSGVVHDSRVLREAGAASGSGYQVELAGRRMRELGAPAADYPFEIVLLDIPRAEGKAAARKVAERVRIGMALARRAMRFQPDIIHCNDFDTLPFGYCAALVCGSALVYDSHELWSENEWIASSGRLKKMIQAAEGYLISRCDCVVCVSNASGHWLRARYAPDALCVVTNCPSSVCVEGMDKHPGFELLCHGQFAPDRGFEELIACAEHVEEAGISVRVRGFGLKTDYYRGMAEKTGRRNLFFCDRIAPERVVAEAARSHVGVVLTRPVTLSYQLTVSNKLFEFLHAGLPVILSDVPEHRLLHDRYRFGILLGEISAQSLAAAAIRLKRDVRLYKELSGNARRAAKELCWEKEKEKLIHIYQLLSEEGLQQDEANLA